MASSSQPKHQQQADDLLAAQKLLRATLDSSTDMIQVFEAVRNGQGEIIDFTWILNNHASEKIYGDVVGKRLLELQPGVVKEGIFEAFTQVVETGLPQQYEKHYVHEQFDGWFHQSVVKLDDGVATTTADITTRKRAEQQVQQSKDLLQQVIDASSIGIAVYKAIRNEQGYIIDFVHEYINRASVEMLGGEDFTGRPFSDHGENAHRQMPQFIDVIETQTPSRYIREAPLLGRIFWFAITNTPIAGDQLVHTWEDVTEQVLAEREILRLKEDVAQRATDKYESIFNAIDDGLAIVEVLPDQQGRVTDMIWREANAGVERNAGISGWVGNRASDMVPHLEQAWLDAMTHVYQTGEPVRMEAYIADLDRWISTFYGRIGGQGSRLITSVFRDITERKLREVQQAYRLRLSDALSQLSQAQDIKITACRVLVEHLQASRAFYVEGLTIGSEDFYQVSGQYSTGMEIPVVPIPVAYYQTGAAPIYEGHIAVGNDVLREIPPEEQGPYLDMDLQAFVVVPLLKELQAPVLFFGVHDNKPRHWRADEIELVKETAERTWAAVERAKAEEALRQSQQRFESIANLVPDLLWESRPDGATNWYNQRWLEYTGQRFDKAIDWGWMEAIHPDDRDASAKGYREAVAAGTWLRQEQRIRRYDGAYRWFVVSASPLKDATGQVVTMYGAATDIHESKQAAEALQQADQRKDEFLAMLAHELRNPMATLHNTLLLLTMTGGQDESLPLDRAIAMMSREATHLNRMVDDLLDVSRISRGKIELKKGRINLVELVRQVQQSLASEFDQQGKELHVSLPSTPIELEGDATRLTQVVANLLTNGLRYTGDGGQVWVSLHHQPQSSDRPEAILQVRDNGIGLANDQLSAIFGLFVQVDNSTARSKGGLGLGLTLVNRLVDLHGGRVEAYSEGLGQGSTFTVHLPTLTPAAEPIVKTTSPATDPAAQRILVIDDNADAAITLAMLLKLKGYEAHTRTSGRAGLEAAESLQPAAILLDIGMPDLDGYATCGLIRERPWGKDLVVIALTGYGQEEDRQRTREAGFNGHLVKPVDLEALTKMLTDLLSKDPDRAGLA